MMNFTEKIAALRHCVEFEDYYGMPMFTWDEHEELQGFIDRIEEGSVYD